MSRKRICLVTTPYALFLYFLKFGYNPDDIYIFTAAFPKNVSKNLKHISLPWVYFAKGPLFAPLNSIKGIAKNISGYVKYFYGYLKLRILLFAKTFRKEVSVYGHAHNTFSYMFYENEDVYLIEDGVQNYVVEIEETHKINPIIDFILHVCGIYFLSIKEAHGTHKNHKKVYLTKEFEHPLLKDKIEVIDIEECWNLKTEQEKEDILKIFNIDYHETQKMDEDVVLLLTEPFSEENYMTFDEEIRIYKDIIDKFTDKQVIIKPHPQDKKDYTKIFPDLMVLEKSFPIELLSLIGYNPKIVASTISTALLNFNDCEIYVYDGEIKSDYLNRSRDTLNKMLKEANKTLISK